MTLTLSNCHILTGDVRAPYYSCGNIVIEDEKIKAIGAQDKVPAEGTVLQMHGKLVMSGLINCHNHLPSTLYRNLGSDLRLMDWLETAMWPAQAHMTAEDSYWGSLLNCMEQLQNGITTTVDQYYFADSNARAVKQSGMRAVVGATVFDHPSPEGADTLQLAADFIEAYQGDDRILPCFGPHAPYTESPQTYRRIAELAKRMGVMIHTHIGETKDEVETIAQRYGTTSTKLLEDAGVFENRVISAHNVYLTAEDIAIFAKHRVGAVFCPVSNLKLASGIPDILPFLKAGVPAAFGTDGAESNNALDLLQDAKIGTLLQKTVHADATVLPAQQAFAMLTSSAADIIGLGDQIGKLRQGYQADLIVMDEQYANAVPAFGTEALDTASVLYSLCGKNVESTMVGGKWLMYQRKIVAFDAAEVLRQAQACAARIAGAAGLI